MKAQPPVTVMEKIIGAVAAVSPIIGLIAVAALMSGCNITRIGADPVTLGKRVTTTYLGGDTNRIASVTTEPVYAFRWWGNSYRNCMDTQIQQLQFQYGDATAVVSGYGNEVNVEAVKAIANAVTDITAKVCAAIVSHGGSVAQDAVSKLVSRFVKAGGKAENASVSCADGACTITDGVTTCTDGGCYVE
jgi:hypothetical protein